MGAKVLEVDVLWLRPGEFLEPALEQGSGASVSGHCALPFIAGGFPPFLKAGPAIHPHIGQKLKYASGIAGGLPVRKKWPPSSASGQGTPQHLSFKGKYA